MATVWNMREREKCGLSILSKAIASTFSPNFMPDPDKDFPEYIGSDKEREEEPFGSPSPPNRRNKQKLRSELNLQPNKLFGGVFRDTVGHRVKTIHS